MRTGPTNCWSVDNWSLQFESYNNMYWNNHQYFYPPTRLWEKAVGDTDMSNISSIFTMSGFIILATWLLSWLVWINTTINTSVRSFDMIGSLMTSLFSLNKTNFFYIFERRGLLFYLGILKSQLFMYKLFTRRIRLVETLLLKLTRSD